MLHGVSNAADGSVVARQIVSELRHQYLLAFEPVSRRDGIESRCDPASVPRSRLEVDIGLALRRLIGKMSEGGNAMAPSSRCSRQVFNHTQRRTGGCGVFLCRRRPFFRSTIDLVMLNVTVTGPGGRYVADLAADDFQILEDGHPQDVAYFSPANVPLSVSLMLNTSSSMDDEMVLSKQAAMDFIARLRPGDVAEIVSFDSRVEVLQPMTSNRALLEAAIQRMRAGGSTAL